MENFAYFKSGNLETCERHTYMQRTICASLVNSIYCTDIIDSNLTILKCQFVKFLAELEVQILHIKCRNFLVNLFFLQTYNNQENKACQVGFLYRAFYQSIIDSYGTRDTAAEASVVLSYRPLPKS